VTLAALVFKISLLLLNKSPAVHHFHYAAPLILCFSPVAMANQPLLQP
jgi:hypothetical protein